MNSGFLERYHAESADVLDAILAHSRDCIKLLNLQGEIEYASTSAANALGLAEADEAIGKVWCLFWPDDIRPALETAMITAATGASTRFDGVTRGTDGAERLWEVTISPVRGADRSVTHLLAVSTDVTAQAEAAERNRKRWERAEEKVGYADVVARELLHRLKNQLAVVGAVAKLLARHTHDSQEMASKLEDKLIAMSRAQDLLIIVREQPIGAREAIRQVLQASGAGERIEIAELSDRPLADESIQQLALILGELQTNALKHGALRDDDGRVELSGSGQGGALTLLWHEHCSRPVQPAANGRGGFELIQRLGSACGLQPVIGWKDNGITVQFHVRTAA